MESCCTRFKRGAKLQLGIGDGIGMDGDGGKGVFNNGIGALREYVRLTWPFLLLPTTGPLSQLWDASCRQIH